MKTPLLALGLLFLSLPLGCSSDDPPPDPLAKREGFCRAWAEAACQQKVLDACNAPDKADCVATQSDFCLALVPSEYSSKRAEACLSAVKNAYRDAVLSADDIQVVLKLGAPCDQLSLGAAKQGEACSANEDCNTAGGFRCVIKAGDDSGSCEKPEEMGGGDPCDEPQQVCADGYFCNGENCVAYKRAGATCQGDYQCRPSDHCVLADEEAEDPTCEPRLKRAEPCTADSECQSLYCAKDEDEADGLCADSLVLTLREPLCKNLR